MAEITFNLTSYDITEGDDVSVCVVLTGAELARSVTALVQVDGTSTATGRQNYLMGTK